MAQKASKNTLQNSALEKRTTEELLFFFAHDGSIDFSKKLAAGKILYDKKYDRHKLAEEKKKIKDDIRQQITNDCNPKNIEADHKKELIRNIFWSLALVVFVNSLTIVSNKGTDTFINDLIIELTLTTAIIMAMPFIRHIFKHNTLKNKLEECQRNRELLEHRLLKIEQEWPF
ncbi:hypothetical protein L21SP5_01567 [Salinivirga cyanobacteriivorans]|uniref:Uncharacterized protein n=1 Tax=Salinivirga cyanobacteriivorans TaxID=1307839 RepID=A0A0S2HYX4_9BACT|nr:hypothetical protein [Salinivirga cyanobacteriivorans]ALO15213.1 hypothetical protein L21SP5_01567 [Salinivirga cyanobacteriivorans]